MVIECNFHPLNLNNNYSPVYRREVAFRGRENDFLKVVGESTDKFVRRPVATKSAAGLRGLGAKFEQVIAPVKQRVKEYGDNIKHTYDHKIIFAIVEKEVLGYNTIDSITHDLDKLILYTLGFSKSFVSKFHRAHSAHHVESGKKPNLRSMLCDNIASCPEFKPEKTMQLREYYTNSKELQSIEGLGELLEKYNFGENLDFTKIKHRKKDRYDNKTGIFAGLVKLVPLLIANLI